jgi:hypothetical protein
MYTKAFKGKGEALARASHASAELADVRQRMRDLVVEVRGRKAPFYAVVSSQSVRAKNVRFNRGSKFSVRWRLRNSTSILLPSDLGAVLDTLAPATRAYWIGLIEESLWLNAEDVRVGTAAALFTDLAGRLDAVESM